MKVSFLSENINKKISFVNHAVSNRSTLPILLNFLLLAKKGKFSISATDLEIGIEISVAANIEEEGGITVPAKTFYELLGNIPKGKVNLYTKDNALFFEADRIKTVFQTISADEFPKIYEEKGEKIATIDSKALSSDLPKVVLAAANDAGRPALSGILMEKEEKGGGFLMVATDGYRLSLKKGGCSEKQVGKKDQESLLVPARLIRELVSVKDWAGDIGVYSSVGNNQILFFLEDAVLAGRLIEAEFPNYEKIIPSDFSTRGVTDREEFQKAVKTCSVFAREAANIVKLSLEKGSSSKAGKIVVSASAPSLGETSIDVEAVIEGEENEIAFNARYLLEFLGSVNPEKIIFEMTGPLTPGVFKLDDDKDFLHIIMPIRVQGQ